MTKILSLILILLLSSCASKKPGVEPSFAVYPYDFYEKFNLRTIISSYRGYLQAYCASYPKDFFEQHEIGTADSRILFLENEEKILLFEMVSYNQVMISDRTKDNSYKSKSLYTFYYNEEHDDFRTDEFFIPKKEGCKNDDRLLERP